MDPVNTNCGYTALLDAVRVSPRKKKYEPYSAYFSFPAFKMTKEAASLKYYHSLRFTHTHKGICLRRTMGLPAEEFARFIKTQDLDQIKRWLFIQKKLNFWVKKNPANHARIAKWTDILQDHMETQYEATLHPSFLALLKEDRA